MQFRGPVSCRREPFGPPAITLTGRTAQYPDETLAATLTLAGAAPADLPETLADARILRSAAGDYGIGAGTRDWPLAARGLHLHRDVGAAFYRALPPRPAPRLRRWYLTAVLRLVASRAGLKLLRVLRR